MEHEATIRLTVFLGLFAVLALAERLLPRRIPHAARTRRWGTNIAIVIIDSIALRLVAIALPLLAIGAALDAQSLGFGLFHNLDLPIWLEWVLVILILDFLIWFQHLMTHKIPLLWRLHQVHHADVDIDVTTAIRFHPLEIALSMLLKIGAI